MACLLVSGSVMRYNRSQVAFPVIFSYAALLPIWVRLVSLDYILVREVIRRRNFSITVAYKNSKSRKPGKDGPLIPKSL